MVMKISNYSGTASTFTFPNNPNTFDDNISSNYTIENITYQRHHIFISGGGVNPKSVVLTGHFFGTDKNTNYRTLSGHFMENYKLKKLYFDSDRFYLGIGKEIKKTHTGGRTNFLDYVATFETIVGILFDDTQQEYTQGGADKTNAGNVTTFIEEIIGDYDGTGDIVISDNLGNELTIPAASCGSEDDEIIIRFVQITSSGGGVYTTKFRYTSVAGTQINSRTTNGFGLLQLAAGESIADMTLTGINLKAGYKIKFRNAYSS